MHRTITAVVAVAILAVGCDTIVPLDVDGSRSDGTILMAAETTLGDTVDWQAGSQVRARQMPSLGLSRRGTLQRHPHVLG